MKKEKDDVYIKFLGNLLSTVIVGCIIVTALVITYALGAWLIG